MASGGKRIAKNTVYLYIRMFIVVLVSLYTVRVVIRVLGVEDYGIYSAVGGIVLLMSFLSQTISFAAQRYFSFEIGRGDYSRLKKIFSSILLIYVIIALLVAIVAEFAGLWFLDNKMVIPTDRMESAHWVLHFSLLSFVVSIFYSPYNAIVIAHENMKIYAYVSIIEALIKLGIVFLLLISPADKLVFYSLLMFISHLIIALIYGSYCFLMYKETRFHFCIDKPIMKELLGYSSWTLFGCLASGANNQGVNLLLNSFFGPVVNASYSVSHQVGNTLQMFGANLFASIRPPMIKRYAIRQFDEVRDLLFKSTKYISFLLLLVMLPLYIEIHFILKIWLGEVVEYMVDFSRLAMIYVLILQLSNPLTVIAQAANKVNLYHGIVDSFVLLSLIVAYFLLRIDYPAQSVYWVMIGIMFLAHFIRMLIVRSFLFFSFVDYLKKAIFPFVVILFLSGSVLGIISKNVDEGWMRFFVISITSTLLILSLIYIIGLNRNEKKFLANYWVKKKKYN